MTRPSGGRPRRLSRCAPFLAWTWAIVGSTSGEGRGTGGEIAVDGSALGAGGDITFNVSDGAGLASWYSQALSAIPELARTSKGATAHGQECPPCAAMPPPYRHVHRRRPPTSAKLFLAEQLQGGLVLFGKPLTVFGFQAYRSPWVGIVCNVRQFHSQGNGVLANCRVVSVVLVVLGPG